MVYVFFEEVYELLRVAEKTVHRATEAMKIWASEPPLARGRICRNERVFVEAVKDLWALVSVAEVMLPGVLPAAVAAIGGDTQWLKARAQQAVMCGEGDGAQYWKVLDEMECPLVPQVLGAVVRYLAESPLCTTEWLMPGAGELASAWAQYSAFWECTAHTGTSMETMVAGVLVRECADSLRRLVGGVVYGGVEGEPLATQQTEEQLEQWVPAARDWWHVTAAKVEDLGGVMPVVPTGAYRNLSSETAMQRLCGPTITPHMRLGRELQTARHVAEEARLAAWDSLDRAQGSVPVQALSDLLAARRRYEDARWTLNSVKARVRQASHIAPAQLWVAQNAPVGGQDEDDELANAPLAEIDPAAFVFPVQAQEHWGEDASEDSGSGEDEWAAGAFNGGFQQQ